MLTRMTGTMTEMLVLSDVETVAVGKAFDRAWDSFLKKGLLTPHNLHDARARLAERILRSVLAGERDEWRLARDAVADVQAQVQAQVQGCLPGVTPPVPQPPARPRFRKRPNRARRDAAPTGLQIACAAAHFAGEAAARPAQG